MKYSTAVLIIAALSLPATRALAQEVGPGPGKVEVTAIPGGATFFTSGDNEAEFHNYGVGGSLIYNINRYVGIEGEVDGLPGLTQDLSIGGATVNEKTPNMMNYTGNVIVSAPVHRGIAPYVAGGAGGLTVFQRSDVAVNDNETFFTGNVGAGVKWYANRRVGLRADYRYLMIKSSDTASSFFGEENRFAHRIYGGIQLNVVR
jgi:opacity protein-like surface antigen